MDMGREFSMQYRDELMENMMISREEMESKSLHDDGGGGGSEEEEQGHGLQQRPRKHYHRHTQHQIQELEK